MWVRIPPPAPFVKGGEVMSRSYKRTPRWGDKKDKYFKKYSNRHIRRNSSEDNLKHKSYKKVICSYNICDCETVGMTFEQYWISLVNSWYRWRKNCGYPFPNKEKAYQDYCRYFLRK